MNGQRDGGHVHDRVSYDSIEWFILFGIRVAGLHACAPYLGGKVRDQIACAVGLGHRFDCFVIEVDIRCYRPDKAWEGLSRLQRGLGLAGKKESEHIASVVQYRNQNGVHDALHRPVVGWQWRGGGLSC